MSSSVEFSCRCGAVTGVLHEAVAAGSLPSGLLLRATAAPLRAIWASPTARTRRRQSTVPGAARPDRDHAGCRTYRLPAAVAEGSAPLVRRLLQHAARQHGGHVQGAARGHVAARCLRDRAALGPGAYAAASQRWPGRTPVRPKKDKGLRARCWADSCSARLRPMLCGNGPPDLPFFDADGQPVIPAEGAEHRASAPRPTP